MTHHEIIEELKAGKVRPVYLLHGQEPYFIDEVSNYAEHHLLNESEQAFNLTICYGRDTEPMTVVDAARRYPMMARFQVIIIKEAQDMKNIGELQSYVENPTDTTVLFICHKHKLLRMNTKLGAALKEKALIMEAKPLYEDKLPPWIENYLKSKNYKITPKALKLVVEYLGAQLSKVVNEMDKLALHLPPGTTITENHIETYIGISKDYNVFELQSALAKKDTKIAGRIVQYVEYNPKPMPIIMVIGVLYNFFSKLWALHTSPHISDRELASTLKLRGEYALRDYREAAKYYSRTKVEDVIAILHEYDLKAKGVTVGSNSYTPGQLLKEMVWKILH